MRHQHFSTVECVVACRLCTGCGACVYACPGGAIELIDIPEEGLQPVVNPGRCEGCGACITICPGIEVCHQPFSGRVIPELRRAWGPVLEVWEGHATDSEIRFKGSSGGVVTAIALFCLEQKQMVGALQIGADARIAWKNATVLSRTRKDLLTCSGSRYSPAAPCEKLRWIEEAEGNCVFIGKPCDVAALRKIQATNPTVLTKVGLVISIFCAGTPTTQGTKSLLEALEIAPGQVEELRYRGCGWPGMTTAKIRGGKGEVHQMSYEESWRKFLSHHTQFRCRLCPDCTGEFADLACGDPWYRSRRNDEPGRSLILARTARGQEILQKAMSAGYISCQRAGPHILHQSQKSLLRKRQNLFGRLFAMRIIGIPTPRFGGFSLFSNWLGLPVYHKIRSVLGTLYRTISRKESRIRPSGGLVR